MHRDSKSWGHEAKSEETTHREACVELSSDTRDGEVGREESSKILGRFQPWTPGWWWGLGTGPTPGRTQPLTWPKISRCGGHGWCTAGTRWAELTLEEQAGEWGLLHIPWHWLSLSAPGAIGRVVGELEAWRFWPICLCKLWSQNGITLVRACVNLLTCSLWFHTKCFASFLFFEPVH